MVLWAPNICLRLKVLIMYVNVEFISYNSKKKGNNFAILSLMQLDIWRTLLWWYYNWYESNVTESKTSALYNWVACVAYIYLLV